MAILHYKDSNGNWVSAVDHNILANIKAGVDQLLEGAGACTHHIIESGLYTFIDTPNVDIEPMSEYGEAKLFVEDILLYNTTSLSYSYGIQIYCGASLTLTMAPWSITTIPGTTKIYSAADGWTNNYSKTYKVAYNTVVSEAFYNWWQANTIKQ